MPARLVGLTGYKGSGKSTIARELAKRGWVVLSFADALRDAALDLNPIVGARVTGPDPWDYEVERLADLVNEVGWDMAKKNDEVRRILQVLGTEVGRALDPDVWVNQMAHRMGAYVSKDVVIDDVRFANEVEFIRQWKGARMVRIIRPGVHRESDHPSEKDQESFLMDHVLLNAGSVEEETSALLEALNWTER
jgi:dephospho-CoA kinase